MPGLSIGCRALVPHPAGSLSSTIFLIERQRDLWGKLLEVEDGSWTQALPLGGDITPSVAGGQENRSVPEARRIWKWRNPLQAWVGSF